jgi:outer membrane protein
MRLKFNKTIILAAALAFAGITAFGQAQPQTWDLKTCINYAIANNIQVKKMQLDVKSSQADYEQSKWNLWPSLNAGISQSFSNESNISGIGTSASLSGGYSLKSDMTLYNGNKLKNTILQQEMLVKSTELSVAESQNSIELAVTTAYLQVLYAREAVTIAENTLSSSQAQLSRAKVLFESGYIAESNLAQVQSQYGNDKYSLVTAQNSLNQQILALKQLLELDITQTLDIYFPDIDDTDVLKILPAKEEVYHTALSFMPEVANSKLNIDIANKNIAIARAGLLPSLSMSASAGTGNSTASTSGFVTQLGNNFYQNAGLTLSIPIFNSKQVKTSIAKAQIASQTAELSKVETEKNLLQDVETAYLDAVSAQSRFQAATEQKAYASTSFTLVEEQFNLGMKNTVDLLTAKTTYLQAQQEYLQAKYTAILNYKLLDFYQQKPIEL